MKNYGTAPELGPHNIDVSQNRKLLHICSGHPLQVNLQIYWLQLCNCSTCMLIDNFHLTESPYIVVNSMFTVEASEFPSQNCLHLIINTVQYKGLSNREICIANW